MPKPLKIGLIGVGNIAGAHLRGIGASLGRLKLTAFCDVNPQGLQRRSDETGVKAIFTDIDRMLREADIDAVDVCTTHDLHATHAIAAARAGKHVIVEKPMACSLIDCRRMVAAARKAKVTLMVAQMQRYTPSFVALKKAIDAGELGKIRAVRIDAMQNGPDGLGRTSWLMDGRRAGGGIIISVAVHKIDLMRYFIGDVKRVTAIAKSIDPAFKHGAEDYVAAILEFKNGAIGELFGTFAGFRMPWAESFMIFGDKGSAHAVPNIGDYGGGAFIASKKSCPKMKSYGDMFKGFAPIQSHNTGLPTDDAFANQLLHFADCCRSGREPISSGSDNIGTMKVVLGIYQSARTGKPVEL